MRRTIILIGLAAVVAAGCSSPEPAPVGARQAELEPALLTVGEVLDAPGAPGGLKRAEDGSVGLTQDSDTRGPCGTPVDQIPFDGGAVAVFGRPDIVVVHLVLAETGGLAERVITDNRADFTAGCPAYTKVTPESQVQVTELIREVELPEVGDDRFGFLIRGTVADAEPVYGLQALVRFGDDLSAIIVFSAAALDDGFAQHLTRVGAERLAAWRA